MRHGIDVITDGFGTQCWYLNGKLHRENGPARIFTNGAQQWYFNHQLHRTDGPAVIDWNGSHRWYLNGNRISKDDVNQWMKNLDITYPFDEEHQALFLLTFGGG